MQSISQKGLQIMYRFTKNRWGDKEYLKLKVIDFCNLFVTIDYNEAANGCGLFNQTNEGWP